MMLTLYDVILGAIGLIILGSAMAVVTTQHLVRAGLWLVLTLGGVAVEFLMLRAEFVAWVQVLIYVGAIVVLLLFAVMLTRAPIGRSTDLDRPVWPALLIGGGSGLGLSSLFAGVYAGQQIQLPPTGSAERLGSSIFHDWVLPFEVLSVLLLAALIGAIILSRQVPPPSSVDPLTSGDREPLHPLPLDFPDDPGLDDPLDDIELLPDGYGDGRRDDALVAASAVASPPPGATGSRVTATGRASVPPSTVDGQAVLEEES